MSRYLLIDGNSVGFAAQAGTKLTVGDREVQGIYGFIRTLRATLARFPDATPIVLWDGKAKWRFELFPGYKDREGKNKVTDELRATYKEQRPDIGRALAMLGVTQMIDADSEADDLAAHLVKKFSKDRKVVLMSGDKDWQQLVNPNCFWFDHRSEARVGVGNFTDETGYLDTNQFIQGKALVGDTSDTIPGVGGIGEKGAPKFLAEWGSVDNFFEKADKGELGKVGKVLQRFADNEPNPKTGIPMRDAYERNLKLMDLGRAPTPANLRVIRGRYDEAAFTRFCEELLFNSLLREFDNWIAPFRDRQAPAKAA